MSRTQKILTEKRNILLTYFIAFVLGGILLLVGLWQTNWNLGAWVGQPFVFGTLIFSETIVRLMAGFGLILTWIAVFELLLTVLSNVIASRRTEGLVKGAKVSETSMKGKITGAIKGIKISELINPKDVSDAFKGQRVSAVLEGKKGQKARTVGVVFFLVLIPIAILGYTAYRFYLFYRGAALGITDVAMLLIGIWGLLITVYINPIARGEHLGFKGKIAELRDKLMEVEVKKRLFSMKKRIVSLYQNKPKKEEAKAEAAAPVEEYAEAYSASHAQDVVNEYEKMGYEKVRETILTYRYRIRDDLLLPFAFGSIIVPPIAFVFFAIWARAFILRREVGQTLAERLIVIAGVLLVGLSATVLVIAIYLFPGSWEHSVIIDLNGVYLLGVFLGCMVFMYLARKALIVPRGK